MQELFTAQCKTALICANGLIPPESEKPHNMVALLSAKFLHNLEKFLQYTHLSQIQKPSRQHNTSSCIYLLMKTPVGLYDSTLL